MRVAKFRVERYRSIERSESIDLSALTVLVGPNNEGKSNILRALVVGLEALRQLTPEARYSQRAGRLSQRLSGFESYVWPRDFPKRLQISTPKASSVFEFEFELDSDDVASFRSEVGHHLNGELKLRVLIADEGNAAFRVVKRGPGSAGLNSKIREIAKFVTKRVRVEYVPVTRASDQSQELIRREASLAVQRVFARREYQEAAETISALIAEELAPLEARVLSGVQDFLPDVAGVSIRGELHRARLAPADFEVLVDDGSLTSLATKGDGVQSLVAISLVRALARRASGVTYMLAVEEPEAHLHPGAVHKLRAVLNDLATTDQVILTTHSPIFVNRSDPSANILVRSNSAAPARSLRAVRESLGIQLPDNLEAADVALLVEGVHDATVVSHVLRNASATIATALDHGRLTLQAAGGAQNVPYHYRLLRDSACAIHVLLDDDREGRKARIALETSCGIVPADITVVSVVGMSEAELEDLLDEQVYSELLMREFNVKLSLGEKAAGKRFSQRMADEFAASGQAWSSSTASNLKLGIARAVSTATAPVVRPDRSGVFEALVRGLELKLSAK